jgi:hypothetical protein
MFKATRAFLDDRCIDGWDRSDPVRAAELLSSMGPLGRAWLMPEIVAAAEQFVGAAAAPEVAASPGEFGVLLVTPGHDRYRALRKAFVLPLRWAAGETDSPHLPPGLAAAAAAVIERHAADFNISPPATGRWTLHPGATLGEVCDLSRLDFECGWESATASMLAGLELASLGVSPEAGVMASVAWDGRTLVPVVGVADKLDAARDAGAHTLFLAKANEDDVRAWKKANSSAPLRTIHLESAKSLRESLGPLFDVIEARPTAAAPLAVLQRFYETRLLLRDQETLRQQYYLDTLAGRLAQEYRGQRPIEGDCRSLIGVVAPGKAPPLAFLARLLAPKRVLLLHDTKATTDALAIRTHLRSLGIQAEPAPFDSFFEPLENLRTKLSDTIGAFLGIDSGRDGRADTVIDLTAGSKRLSFLLLELAPPGSVCVHIDSLRTDRGNMERIATEDVVPILRR